MRVNPPPRQACFGAFILWTIIPEELPPSPDRRCEQPGQQREADPPARSPRMNESPVTSASARRPRPLRWLFRGLALAVPLLLVALLVYGVAVQSPSTTIDDSLAHNQPPAAPAFRLGV